VEKAPKHLGEVAPQVNVVQLAGHHPRGHRGPSRAAIVSANKQRVFSAEADQEDGALGGFVGQLDPAVVEEPYQPLAVIS